MRQGYPNQFVTPRQFLPITCTQTETEAGGGETSWKEVKSVDSKGLSDLIRKAKRQTRNGKETRK